MKSWVCFLPASLDPKVFQRLVHIRMDTVPITRLSSLLHKKREDDYYVIVKTKPGFLTESVEVIKESFPNVSVLWAQTFDNSTMPLQYSKVKHIWPII
ncbi:hypothetical protein EON65_56455 [archaeon]|nr:MAG: hypothetical protein EON65_56455 [archaeon]